MSVAVGTLTQQSLAQRVERVTKAAQSHADDVDFRSRFPEESIEAARFVGLLGAPIRIEDGGLGYSVTELCEIVRAVAHHCSSSAMILAMHYSQLLCLIRHGKNDYLLEALRRCAREQLLLASATTEIHSGGNTRVSSCAVEPVPGASGRISLAKTCPVISYGHYADAVLVTARRSLDSAATDQVIVYIPEADLLLNRTSEWNALGMRGTCSAGFSLSAATPAAGILNDPFETVSAQTMLPASHSLWASVWLGMATEAGLKARAVVQKAARSNPASPPPSALRLAELEVGLQTMADTVTASICRFQNAQDKTEVLESLPFIISMNTLKVSSATLVHRIVSDAMIIVGMQGFSTTSPLSLARLFRDSIAPSIMVNNDRILAHTSVLQLISRGDR